MSSAKNLSNRQKVLGYPVDVLDEGEAVCRIETAMTGRRGLHVVTLNSEMVILAQKDQDLDRVIRRAHLIVPDGAGAVFALRLDGHKSVRVPGIELAWRALGLAEKHGLPVALIGGRQEVLEKLVPALKEAYPQIDIVACQDGYFDTQDEEAIVEEIAALGPRLVLVAMGVPRQEYFIERWAGVLSNSVLIGVGGSFDVWAGFVNRAPAVFRACHLEWLYRLMKEPWRAGRILYALPNFALQVLARRFFGAERVYLSDNDQKASGSKGGRWRRVKKSSRPQDRSRQRSKDM